MRITITAGPARKMPRPGDTRTTKKHGPQVRVPVAVQHGPNKGAYVVSRGRQCYAWVSPANACAQGLQHLVPPEWRPVANACPLGYMRGRGAA